MLYILGQFGEQVSVLNVFRYITFRTAGATMTAIVFVFLFGPTIIAALRVRQGKGQPIREDGPQNHLLTKKGTPTMGGLMILSGLVVTTLLWANLANLYVWVVLFVTIGFGAVGFYDDYLKVSKAQNSGFSGRSRLAIEAAIAVVAGIALAWIGTPPLSTGLTFPFLKDVVLNLGWFFVPVAAFVIVGAGNAVNLTDGLDGLAIVPVMIAAASFALIAYLSGNAVFADYLQIHFVPGTGELAVVCGAVLGAVAVATKHEIVLAIVGGLFVLEAVSVIIQVASFKLTGKRVFRMAPIHHHFEALGWTEAQIVIRFWIIAVLLALVGLSSLKIR